MAKQKPAAEAEGTSTPATAGEGVGAKTPAVAKGNSDKFTFLKDPVEGQKFAPQANLIIKHVKAANELTRDALVEALGKDADFKTKQPIGRIISYYQASLVASGVLSVTK